MHSRAGPMLSKGDSDNGGSVAAARVVTVPNALTVMRMTGAGVMAWLAFEGYSIAFLCLFAVLLLTDWLDGLLAGLLHERSTLGARLDSIADVLMYTALVLGTLWLERDFVESQLVLLTLMSASYVLSVAISLIRFRKLPAYHTLAAKTGWAFVAIAVACIFLGGLYWPGLIAIVAVVLINLEAIAMSLVLDEWRSDVPSLWHALRPVRNENDHQPTDNQA